MKPPFIVLAALLVLTGCIADERGHAVKLGKGGYSGPPDTEIGDATRLALRSRVLAQAGGPAVVAVDADAAEIPQGQTVPSGRITGQRY